MVNTMINTKFLEILCCPSCKSDLILQDENLVCTNCHKQYSIIDSIPILLTENVQPMHFEKQKEYFNNEFKVYTKYVLSEWQKMYINRISNFFGFNDSNLTEKGLFIDIGVGGSGYTVIEFAKLGMSCIGCDLSFEGVTKAKIFSELQNVSDRTFWVVCSAEELPFKDNKFEYLCCNAVLEHLPNDKKAIDDFGRITKSNAKIYITVPLKFLYIWPFLVPLNFYHDKRIGHLRRYDKESLEQLFENINFKVKNVYYTGHLFKVLGVIVSYIIKSKKFDIIIEDIDAKAHRKRYGASNIGILFSRENYIKLK